MSEKGKKWRVGRKKGQQELALFLNVIITASSAAVKLQLNGMTFSSNSPIQAADRLVQSNELAGYLLLSLSLLLLRCLPLDCHNCISNIFVN